MIPVMADHCERLSGYQSLETPLTTAAAIQKAVEAEFQKDITGVKESDPEILKQAQETNAKAIARTETLGTFGGYALQQTVIRNYFSLVDGYAGKSVRIVWYEHKGQTEPIYLLSSCHFDEPRWQIATHRKTNLLFDSALQEVAGADFPTLYWKITATGIEKTTLDEVLEKEADRLEAKHHFMLDLRQGFDPKKLRYRAQARTTEDCTACASGPLVTIQLKETKEGYRVSFSSVKH